MNDELKTKFYKRRWFVLLAGSIAGAALTILALFLYSNPQYLTSLPFAREAKNAITGDKERVVTIASNSGCYMSPSEIKFEVSDYKTDGFGNNSAKILFKNSDDRPHNIGASGVSGTIPIPAKSVQEFPVSVGIEAETMAITCDGKESLKVSLASNKETIDRNAVDYASGEFGRLPSGIKDCANKILGSDNLPKLFARSLSISPDEQANLSLCFYDTLSAENKKCVVGLAGGEQNLEAFFKNIPSNGDNLGNTAKCVGIERYSSLLAIPQVK